MNRKSKTFAIAAMIVTTVMGVAVATSPAEARRYKQKIVRHNTAVVPFNHPHNIGVVNPFAQMARARATRVQRVNRKFNRRAVRMQRASRASVRVQRASRGSARAQRILRASRAPAARAAFTPQVSAGTIAPNFGVSGLVSQARRYLGTNPTGMSALWCARFMNMVLEKSGHRGTGSNMARSFANYGRRISGPRVGAIAVMSRGKRGGHVGIVSGIDKRGNPIVISGNHNRRVGEAAYPRGRIYAYVMP